MFNLEKLFVDVFHPEVGERVVVVCDEPTGGIQDDDLWAERRQMAADWHAALTDCAGSLGISVAPLVTFPAVGSHNGDLPLKQGHPVSLAEALADATIGLALTEFSPTAPMVAWAKEHEDFRCATLPGVAKRTEVTALAADYVDVARRCAILRDLLDDADSADVVFSTGHEWHVDLRHRKALVDDGQLPRGNEGGVINLPSGESFQVPYEGDRDDDPSATSGEIPVPCEGGTLVYRVEANRIVDVIGSAEQKAFFEADSARGNIAEFAFGCNPEAVVWGNVLEDEKAGFHWAYGRSEHLGGCVGPDAFRRHENVVHQDIVYAEESPIQVVRVALNGPDATTTDVILNSQYTVL